MTCLQKHQVADLFPKLKQLADEKLKEVHENFLESPTFKEYEKEAEVELKDDIDKMRNELSKRLELANILIDINKGFERARFVELVSTDGIGVYIEEEDRGKLNDFVNGLKKSHADEVNQLVRTKAEKKAGLSSNWEFNTLILLVENQIKIELNARLALMSEDSTFDEIVKQTVDLIDIEDIYENLRLERIKK